MRKRSYYFLAIGIILAVFPISPSLAKDQKTSPADIEIIIQGKKYESIRAYRRDQIKTSFEDALSSRDLREFSEDELNAIIKEIRQKEDFSISLQNAPRPVSQATIGENAEDLGTLQMERMLKSYLKEHKDIDPIVVDPGKVKHVIIKN